MLVYDIFIRAHYLFRFLANGFPKAKLEENCALRATDNVQGLIFGNILQLNSDGSFSRFLQHSIFQNWERSLGCCPVLAAGKNSDK